MKSRTLKFAVGAVLLADLGTPFLLVAQKTSYKLIDRIYTRACPEDLNWARTCTR